MSPTHLPVPHADTLTLKTALLYLALHQDLEGTPNFTQAAEVLQIAKTTLWNWWQWWQAEQAKPVHEQRVTLTDVEITEARRIAWNTQKEALFDLDLAIAQKCGRIVLAGQDDSGPCSARELQHYMWMYGVAHDKLMLLRGEATARTDARVVHGRIILPEEAPVAALQAVEQAPHAPADPPALPAVPTREADPVTPQLRAQIGRFLDYPPEKMAQLSITWDDTLECWRVAQPDGRVLSNVFPVILDRF